jgi:hypothetical protein
VEIGFSNGIKEISSKWGSWKLRRNGILGNFIEMGFVEISSKWGFPKAPIKALMEVSSKYSFPKICIKDLVDILWK